MSSQASAQVKRFEVILHGRARTLLADVQRFIEEHADAKSNLIVEINGAGMGDCWADRLEEAGFTVKRFYSSGSRSSVSSNSST